MNPNPTTIMIRHEILENACAQLCPSTAEQLKQLVKDIHKDVVLKIESMVLTCKYHYIEYAQACEDKRQLNLMYLAGMPDKAYYAVLNLKGWD